MKLECRRVRASREYGVAEARHKFGFETPPRECERELDALPLEGGAAARGRARSRRAAARDPEQKAHTGGRKALRRAGKEGRVWCVQHGMVGSCGVSRRGLGNPWIFCRRAWGTVKCHRRKEVDRKATRVGGDELAARHTKPE